MRSAFPIIYFLPAVILTPALPSPALAADWWRSALYPADWVPPKEVSFLNDAFLQDFSYAGYQRNERPLPDISEPVFSAVEHGADPTGSADSTAAIQAAINAAKTAGGGVVLLDEGTYKVAPPGSQAYALLIESNAIVLRGAGVERTFIVNTRTDMRQRSVIAVRAPSGGNWRTEMGSPVAITADLHGPTRRIPVADTIAFAAGQWVVLRADATPDYMADLQMADLWGSPEARAALGGPLFYRKITAVNPAEGFIEIDAPTRFFLLRRDNARVVSTHELLSEIGLEEFSIGNLEHPGTSGWGEEDYHDPSAASYDAHDSWLVSWQGVRDSWMRAVHSFQPMENSKPVHMLSNGVRLSYARGLTLDNVDMQRPQYGGGGGNGYMIRFSAAQECLAIDCKVRWNRHGFVFSGMQTSGNVIFRGLAQRTAWQAEGGRTNGRGSDHHMHLSQSNLVDSVVLDEDFFQAAWRGLWGGHPHGLTATHSVFWNLEGQRYFAGRSFIVESEQFAYGYIIGTRGPAPGIHLPRSQGSRTDPIDYIEGISEGDTLWPLSLYEDQLARRLGHHDPGPPELIATAPAKVRFPERRARLEASVEGGDAAPDELYLWEPVSGPRPAHLTSPDAQETWAVVDLPGTYSFRVSFVRADWNAAREVTVTFLPLHATLHELPAEAATYVRDGGHANTNYGAAPALEVKNDGSGFSRQAFLRFDIGDLTEPVTSATLHLTSVHQGLTEMEHVVHSVAADSWEENTLTWNTRPTVLDLLGSVPVREGLTWTLDVTNAIHAANDKFAVRLAAPVNFGSQGWMSYAGRTSDDPAARPRLVIRTEPEPKSYDTWWESAPHTPAELRAPDADASGDGQPNRLAFLRGLDPLDQTVEPMLRLSQEETELILRWTQDARVTTMPYRIEQSHTLKAGDWEPVIEPYTLEDAGSLDERLYLRVAVPSFGPIPLFFRIHAEAE